MDKENATLEKIYQEVQQGKIKYNFKWKKLKILKFWDWIFINIFVFICVFATGISFLISIYYALKVFGVLFLGGK